MCYKEEASGYRSKRQWENEDWSKVIEFDEIISQVEEDGTAPFNIHYADMKLGNKCDLACLMCNPADSSLWIPDHNKLMKSDISDLTKDKLEWKKGEGKLNWYKLDSVFWEDIEQVCGHVPCFPVAPFIAYLRKNWDESSSDRSFGKNFSLNVRNAESDEKRICCRSCAELHGDNQVSKESK